MQLSSLHTDATSVGSLPTMPLGIGEIYMIPVQDNGGKGLTIFSRLLPEWFRLHYGSFLLWKPFLARWDVDNFKVFNQWYLWKQLSLRKKPLVVGMTECNGNGQMTVSSLVVRWCDHETLFWLSPPPLEERERVEILMVAPCITDPKKHIWVMALV